METHAGAAADVSRVRHLAPQDGDGLDDRDESFSDDDDEEIVGNEGSVQGPK